MPHFTGELLSALLLIFILLFPVQVQCQDDPAVGTESSSVHSVDSEKSTTADGAAPDLAEKHPPQETDEEEHKPRKVRKSPVESEVLSFSKYEPLLRKLCLEMDQDGRRTKLSEIAQREGKSYGACPSCRALWRSIDRSCRAKVERKTAETSPHRKSETTDEGEQHSTEAEAGAEEKPTPAPTPPPKRERYPSPVVLDIASRLGDSLHDSEAEDPIRRAVTYVDKVIRSDATMTPAERDYFDILLTYLQASWQGRFDPDARPTPRQEELNSFFN